MTTPSRTTSDSTHTLAQVPSSPPSFVPSSGARYRGFLPLETELAVLDAAIEELTHSA